MAEPTPLDERTERVIWEMVDSLGTIDGVAMNDWGEGDPDFLKARDALRNRIRELVEEAREAGFKEARLCRILPPKDRPPLVLGESP